MVQTQRPETLAGVGPLLALGGTWESNSGLQTRWQCFYPLSHPAGLQTSTLRRGSWDLRNKLAQVTQARPRDNVQLG